MPRALLLVELLIIFVGLPLAFRYSPVRLPALPVLWAVAGYAWWQLWWDKSFDRRQLWNSGPLAGHLGSILTIFAVVALVLWLGVRRFTPQLEWSFLREHPGYWAMVMALYPVLSVYPQGVLYRSFFFHRYAVLFNGAWGGKWPLLLASAAAFSFLHIIFRSRMAIGLTLLGGFLFSLRYLQTGSLLTSSVEHALYGCWLFTVGMGADFYHGVWPEPK
jgi:hypothetical protein